MLAAYKPERGYSLFLRAFASIASTRPQVRAVLAGDGSTSIVAAFTALAAGLGIADRVTFVSPDHDLPGFWAAVDIAFICHPGTGGGGSALLEGFASGAAMIVGDQGPLRRLSADGEYARVIPAPNHADFSFDPYPQGTPAEFALTHSLIELIDNQQARTEIAQIARLAALRFTARKMAITILSIINACARRRPQTASNHPREVRNEFR